MLDTERVAYSWVLMIALHGANRVDICKEINEPFLGRGIFGSGPHKQN